MLLQVFYYFPLSLTDWNFYSITKMETKLNQAVIPPLVISDISVGDVCAAKFPVDDKLLNNCVT